MNMMYRGNSEISTETENSLKEGIYRGINYIKSSNSINISQKKLSYRGISYKNVA